MSAHTLHGRWDDGAASASLQLRLAGDGAWLADLGGPNFDQVRIAEEAEGGVVVRLDFSSRTFLTTADECERIGLPVGHPPPLRGPFA